MFHLQGSLKILNLVLLLQIFTALAKEAPCDYWETVTLDYSEVFDNGTYLYDDILVPKNETGHYNYTIAYGNIKIPLNETEVRGCICKLRPCISFCCMDGYYENSECETSDYLPNKLITIKNNLNEIVSVDVNHQFAAQYYRPCKSLYHLDPLTYETDNYTILENGSLIRNHDGVLFTRAQYCLSPLLQNGLLTYTPHKCYLENPTNVNDVKMNGIIFLVSAPFMILTIIVYLILPELRNIKGILFCCYLTALTVAYLGLAFIILIPDISKAVCSLAGYLTYFAFMSAFFWLSVISFDLYTYLFGSQDVSDKTKRLRFYSIFALGLALICVILVFIAHNTSILPQSMRRGFGEDYCFISPIGWSAFLYFYCPLLLVVSFNTVMFVLIVREIKKAAKFSSKKYHQLTWQFLRLFILMGLSWIGEILSYLTPEGSWFENILVVTEFLIAIQGIVIFLLFVCQKAIIQELAKMFGKKQDTISEHSQEITAINNI